MKGLGPFMAYIAILLLALVDSARGPSYPAIIDYFHLTGSKASWASAFFSVASFCGLIMNFSSSWWIKRFQVMKAQNFFLFILALAVLVWGLSAKGLTPQNLELFLLYLGSCLFGLAAAGLSIVMNVVVAKSPVASPRKALSLLHSLYGLASFCAPAILSLLTLAHLKWNHYFLILAPIIAFFALTGAYSCRHLPPLTTSGAQKVIKRSIPKTWLISFGGLFAFYVASEVLLSSRLVLFLEKAQNFTPALAQFNLSLFFAFLLIGRLLFGLITIKIKGPYLLLISLLSTLAITILGPKLWPGQLFISAFFMSWYYPCALGWISEVFDQQLEIMTSWVQTCTGITLVLAHALFGQVFEEFGAAKAMALGPLFSFLALICLLVAIKQVRTA